VNLPKHSLDAIIQIINESEPEILEQGDSECSFDMNLLKAKTLIKLKNYVCSIQSDNTNSIGGGSGLDKKESPKKIESVNVNFVPIKIKKENEELPDSLVLENENIEPNFEFNFIEKENEIKKIRFLKKKKMKCRLKI